MIARLGLRRFYVLGLLIAAAMPPVRGGGLGSRPRGAQPWRRRRLLRAALRGHRGHHRRRPAADPAGHGAVARMARRRRHLGGHRGAVRGCDVREPGGRRAVRRRVPCWCWRAPQSPGGRSGGRRSSAPCRTPDDGRARHRAPDPDLSSVDGTARTIARPLGPCGSAAAAAGDVHRRLAGRWSASGVPRWPGPGLLDAAAAARRRPGSRPGTRITSYSAAAVGRPELDTSSSRIPQVRGRTRSPASATATPTTPARASAARSGDGVSQVDVVAVEGNDVVLSHDARTASIAGDGHPRPCCRVAGAKVPGGAVDGLWIAPRTPGWSSRPGRSVACWSCVVTTPSTARPTRR